MRTRSAIEPEIFVETSKALRDQQSAPKIGAIFQPQFLHTTVTCLFLATGVLGGA